MTLCPDITHSACITSLDEFQACLDPQRNGYLEINTARLYDAEILKEKLEESLRELGTGCLDIYYLHGLDRTTPYAETFYGLDDLLSSFLAVKVIRPTIYKLVPSGRRYGLASIFNPLACGLLLETQSTEKPSDGRFSDQNRIICLMYRDRCLKTDVFDALLLLVPLVAKHGLTLVKVAFRWCVYHSALRTTNGSDSIINGQAAWGWYQYDTQKVQPGEYAG
ncbi:hypothetical protein BDV09DRAFT_206734 [Aspergillus tetrazonus]